LDVAERGALLIVDHIIGRPSWWDSLGVSPAAS
jgi:hypothetical protein